MSASDRPTRRNRTAARIGATGIAVAATDTRSVANQVEWARRVLEEASYLGAVDGAKAPPVR